MYEKRKSTLKAKVLTAVLIILFVGSCAAIIFAICTGNLSRDNNNTPTESSNITDTSTVPSTASMTEASEPETSDLEATSAEVKSIDLASSYNVDYWVEYKTDNGSAGLGVLFGAHTQGAVIHFEGGRFAVSTLSVYETLDVAAGTFSFVSESEVELRYDNSNVETLKIIEAEDSVATVIDFPMDIEGTTLRASIAQ